VVFAESERPTLMEAINDPDPERSQRGTLAALQMKKIDIAGIRKALNHQTVPHLFARRPTVLAAA
jgi:hypothetical protein